MSKQFPIVAFTLVLILAAVITGCSKSYVDPAYDDVKLDQLVIPNQAQKVLLDFSFQQNGEDKESATKTVKPWLVNVLLGSRVFVPAEDNETGESLPKLLPMGLMT